MSLQNIFSVRHLKAFSNVSGSCTVAAPWLQKVDLPGADSPARIPGNPKNRLVTYSRNLTPLNSISCYSRQQTNLLTSFKKSFFEKIAICERFITSLSFYSSKICLRVELIHIT